MLLLYCLCDNSELTDDKESQIISKNQSEIVNSGGDNIEIIDKDSHKCIKEKSLKFLVKLK